MRTPPALATVAARWLAPLLLVLALLPNTAMAQSPTQPLVPDDAGALTVVMTNLRNASGKIRLALFRSQDGWPSDMRKAVLTEDVAIANGTSRITFHDLPFGYYGIIVYHDENDNDDLDVNWLGLPVEGYGISNDARAFMAIPTFEQARVRLNEKLKEISFKISYIL